ncbi:MAG: FtsQ-type POTRA domain-containing protein [Gemmatimonadetes bacterium]|nr:FtsQ-type POTRA domain-containing protein [Gemmatimonadota bacterium]
MTTRQRALIVALGAVAAVAVWIGVPRAMRRLEYFRVRHIEVTGVRFLDERDVVARLALPKTASIVDPLAPVRRNASAIPGVAAASIERRLPGTLSLLVLEELPVALVMQEEKLVLMDRRGRILPFDPTRAPTSLPVAERDSATAALLSAVLRADPEWYGQIESARRDGGDVLLEDGPHRVRIRPGASLETIRGVTAVRAWLTTANRPWQELDARFADRAFVKWATS